ncbi:MAG: hypothetical protein WDA71_12570 [Actinomycetota bacterium]
MNRRYLVVAQRVRAELGDLERAIDRAERASAAVRRQGRDQDLYLDSAALNLHDFYAGLERILRHLATTVDESLPAGPDWHRDLLAQMATAVPKLRPPAISAETAGGLDEYLRFRHVVRNVYAFELDAERLESLVGGLRSLFDRVRSELMAFAEFLDQLAEKG